MTLLARLRGEEAGPPVFAPRVTRLAARLEQISLDQMAENPGAVARALHSAQRLMKHHAMVLDGSDALVAACRVSDGLSDDSWSTLDTEAFIRTSRWRLLLEAVERLRASAGTVEVAVLLPGPSALAEMTGRTPSVEVIETAGEVCAAAARTVAEAGVSIVMIAETDVQEDSLYGADAGIRSVCTLLRYYSAVSVMCIPDSKHLTGPLAAVGADIVVIPAMEPPQIFSRGSVMGLAIPSAWFSRPPSAALTSIRAALEAAPGVRLITTFGEVSEATHPEMIRHASQLLDRHVPFEL